MRMRIRMRPGVLAALALLAGCGANPGTAPAPVPPPPADPQVPITTTPGVDPPIRNDLPPVPPRSGTLCISVMYPAENAALTTADSNFIFGEVGTGGATLTINGAPVDVASN